MNSSRKLRPRRPRRPADIAPEVWAQIVQFVERHAAAPCWSYVWRAIVRRWPDAEESQDLFPARLAEYWDQYDVWGEATR